MMGFCSIAIVLSVISAAYGQTPCEDLDTLACQQLHQNNPDFCSNEPTGKVICKRFCGLCPLKCYSCAGLVRDLHLCTATVSCAEDEVMHLFFRLDDVTLKKFNVSRKIGVGSVNEIQECYTIDIFDANNTHSYRRGCMSKTMCRPDPSILVGRSSLGFYTKCCDSDLCNIERETTTAMSSVATTPRDNNEHCTNLQDLRTCQRRGCHTLNDVLLCQKYCDACQTIQDIDV